MGYWKKKDECIKDCKMVVDAHPEDGPRCVFFHGKEWLHARKDFCDRNNLYYNPQDVYYPTYQRQGGNVLPFHRRSK